MDNNSQKLEANGFTSQVRIQARAKANEIRDMEQEIRRLEVKVERAKEYFKKLNSLLELEGQGIVAMRELKIGSGVGKPGNRSKNMPVRKVQWEGMSLNEIISRILKTSPDVSFHPKEVAPMIYEIQSETDLSMVMKNVRTIMQRGVRDVLWERTGRSKFKAKVTEKQGTLVNA
jgi:hypothetical protein